MFNTLIWHLTKPRKPISVAWERVLVLGSAPYVTRWWENHGACYSDWTVLAINNAWAVPGSERVDVWARSDDFWRLGKVRPPRQVRDKAIRIRSPAHAKMSFPLRGGGGGTMLVSILWKILSEAEQCGLKTTVSIAGSDFDYRGSESGTHFYGAGRTSARARRMIGQAAPEWARGKAADPLRFGLGWLRERLADVEGAFTERGHRVFNVGGHCPTELPFPRRLPGTESRSTGRIASQHQGPANRVDGD
jgi:hypothetical protein